MMMCSANLKFFPQLGWAAFFRASFSMQVLCTVCFCIIASCIPVVSLAGTFSVNPTRIELSKGIPSAVMHVTNSGEKDTTVQLHMLQWSQIDGEDQLKASRDLIATPQIFNLPAGSRQIIRIGMLKKSDGSVEAAYRMILEEIPPPPPPGFLGLQVALKISIPIFIKPELISKAENNFEINLNRSNEEEGNINLSMLNKGSSHVQLLGVKIFADDGKENLVASYEKNLYLLAGQKKILKINAGKKIDSKGFLIKANMNGGVVEFHAKSGVP